MKNLIFGIITASTLLLACNKADIQQTTDTIKTADSLFKTAKEGFKTLDSISKIVNDSNSTVGKVIIPEINKHKKIIEEAVKNGNINIDSLNREFEKLNKKTKQADEIRKAIDSANNAIKSGENAAVIIAETASKILKQTSKKNQTQKQNEPEVQDNNQSQTIPLPQSEKYPISKTARLQISVDNIATAKAILNQELRNLNGDLITENYTENEGVAKEFLTAKVPLSNFNELINNVSGIGSIENKTTEVEGKDYIGSQMCDVEITFVDKNLVNNENNSNDLDIVNGKKESETFGEKSSNAFMQGFKVLGDGVLFLLPFWPILLIGGVAYYFYRKKKKQQEKIPVTFENKPQEKQEESTPKNLQ